MNPPTAYNRNSCSLCKDEPDEYVTAQLNHSRHILERHKVYFTRRTYQSLQRKHSRQR